MSRFRWWAGLALAAVLAAGAFYFLQPETDTTPIAVADPVRPASASPEVGIQPLPLDAPKVERRRVAAGSADPFELIRGLAKAAYDGDAKAQFQVSRELDRCEYTLTLVRKEKNDPETAILNLPWTAAMKERGIAEYRRCIRLMKEDPFAELPPRNGGYSFRYWMQRSAQAGYALAVVDRTMVQIPQANSEARADAVTALALAAVSDEPDAALTIGFRYSASSNDSTSTSGAAWMLAACRMGADCSASSKVVQFDMCEECTPGMDVDLMLVGGLSPAKYAEAYAQSQAIEEILRSKDQSAVINLLSPLTF